ncbi:MAG TPA: DUF1328 domain-containing protein [Xanthobacteraceae bacterium]|jgi:uncharacterized membrane protein YtjA (UPF0391 family)
MLKWAIIFLVISLIAGALGFTNISTAAGRVAKILFAIFFALFVIVIVIAIGIGELLTR